MDKNLNLLVFSGEYDKALAALILADTALSMQMEVTMFFAFWGLLLLRDPARVTSKHKDNLEKMFGMVTPQGAEELPLSRMNMSGLGKMMLKKMMDADDTPHLSDFLNEAREKGAKLYGCKLSAEVMGFSKEELLPEVEIKTAKDYLQEALEADVKLFI